MVTLPFSRCSFVWGDPIIIPKEINEDQINFFQKKLEEKINQLTLKAKQNIL